MKNARRILTLMTLVLFTAVAYAGEDTETVKISTSAQCGMCEKTIDKAMDELEGVESASLNLETQALTVAYNSDEVSADDIRKAISKAGYDADDVKACTKAYKELPSCCKEHKKASGGGC